MPATRKPTTRNTARRRWTSCSTSSRSEADIDKRKAIVWEIERVLAEEVARPIVYHNRSSTCWHAHLKGYVHHENSIYNNWRFEDVWLDKWSTARVMNS